MLRYSATGVQDLLCLAPEELAALDLKIFPSFPSLKYCDEIGADTGGRILQSAVEILEWGGDEVTPVVPVITDPARLVGGSGDPCRCDILPCTNTFVATCITQCTRSERNPVIYNFTKGLKPRFCMLHPVWSTSDTHFCRHKNAGVV